MTPLPRDGRSYDGNPCDWRASHVLRRWDERMLDDGKP